MIYAGTRDGKKYGFYLKKSRLTEYVELTNEEHRQLMKGQDGTKVIKFNGKEKPTLEDAPEPTSEELLNLELESCKATLANTDYIALKLSEALADSDSESIDELKEEYSEQLQQRKDARKRINEIQTELESLAQTSDVETKSEPTDEAESESDEEDENSEEVSTKVDSTNEEDSNDSEESEETLEQVFATIV